MCGIVGVIGPMAAEQDLQTSLDAITLRGPDRQAQVLNGNALLGHTRLSIIDTSSGGDQPMQDSSGRYTLVFNGEIYNYRTIAEELKREEHNFQSNSDTEVLFQLLIEEGIDALKRVNGFFAFAFYDRVEDRCIIARDRLGIKPLFYSTRSDGICFSSEMKGLLPLLSERSIDSTALHFYMRLNYIPTPMSIYDEVRQLEAGHYVIVQKGEVVKRPYYQLTQQLNLSNKNRLRELLTDAVRLRMISDVPLGSFLSGGVDSSIIAALAAEESKGLKTFSIGFKDNPHFDESRYAEQVAEHIGSDHTTIQLHDDEMLEHVEHLLDYLHEPFADSSSIAVHALCAHTRKHVTVALSGDGADELFGGYNKHQAHLMASQPNLKATVASGLSKLLKGQSVSHGSPLRSQLRRLNRFAEGRSLSPGKRYWAWASWTSEQEVSQFLSIPRDEHSYSQIIKDYAPSDDSMEQVLLSDTRLVLPDDMLRKVDRMSMANSLEVRVPFLDHRVVEYAHSLSASARFSKGKGKHILRSQFGDLIPSEIFDRKKKGFEVPLEAWFNGPLQTRLLGVLNDGILAETDLFNMNSIHLLQEKLKHKQIGADVHLLWALMVLHGSLRKSLIN